MASFRLLMASGKRPVRQFKAAMPYQMKSSLGDFLREQIEVLARGNVVAHIHQ